jgi:hypothetical protein
MTVCLSLVGRGEVTGGWGGLIAGSRFDGLAVGLIAGSRFDGLAVGLIAGSRFDGLAVGRCYISGTRVAGVQDDYIPGV